MISCSRVWFDKIPKRSEYETSTASPQKIGLEVTNLHVLRTIIIRYSPTIKEGVHTQKRKKYKSGPVTHVLLRIVYNLRVFLR
ncbi:hypothetical protein JHK82_014138 [Glycine max]|uniref:Uncharacterized protein n=2 Tax=Glycine subgen. Soja TaxID=1462606 RepID=A0A0R0JKG5_SOYBN|nr:hypothetical protein JHK85_014513 [Glycine max]KAG5044760.1 hypothetical protein JHK86_014166 [Glycine max]KAG5147257.1 hypothetical protein JHK82_014138 [Glycine max]KAH1123796.1 hypothetical protein GYH30_013837 [Glycine max]RZC05374.1 hypothetical protein D0Y65_013501 [Glycine soja]